MTAGDVIERHMTWCEAGNLAPRTRRDRRSVLTRVSAESGPLLEATTDALVTWLARFTGHTLETYRGHLVGFFRWAVLHGETQTDPMVRLRRPRAAAAGVAATVGGARPPSVAEWRFWSLAAGHAADSTVADRERVLRKVVEEVGDLDVLTAGQIAEWLGQTNWSQETRAAYFGALRSYYHFAIDTGRVPANPMAKMRRPRVAQGVPKPVTDDQLATVLERASEPYRTMAVLAAFAGLRAGEIARLRREDVTVRTVLVLHGKGGKSATVPTHPAVWEAVGDRPPGPVVRRPSDGKAYASELLCRSFFLHLRSPKLRIEASLHQFRHWFGTAAYRHHRDILVAAQLLRHSNVETARRYALIEDQAAAETVAALPVPGLVRS